MGIGTLIEEVAGAVAAEQAVEKLDPNAGTLVKAAAIVGGFEGASALTGMLEGHQPAAHPAAPAPASDDDIPPDPTLPQNAGTNT